MESPKIWVAIFSASIKPTAVLPTIWLILSMHWTPGFCHCAFLTKAAVGGVLLLSATKVLPSRIRKVVSLPAPTIESQAKIKSALAVPTLVVAISSCVLPIKTWLQVAPPFWAKPAASCVTTPLLSRWAATPNNWPMVMTPVPPTPAITIPQGPSGRSSEMVVGAGNWVKSNCSVDSSCCWLAGFDFLSFPPSTLTKLGQKPFTHEKSLLQVLWLIVRLRPKGVSRGSTLKQFDCTEQSPQPSHTSSLIIIRLAGSINLPRLRRRRFSVAQVWS